MDKGTLRKVYLHKRRLLSADEYERRNQLITNNLVEFFNKNNFESIHIYIPIKKNNEPDTFPFIQYLWTQRTSVEVITGVSDLESPIMHHIKIGQTTAFLENKWGIPEPQDGSSFPIKNIDCVIIPMVVGSKTGHRIGYGKGYYDRFLVQCPDKTKFVGLSMGPLLDGDLYASQYDIPLDIMITPFEIREGLK